MFSFQSTLPVGGATLVNRLTSRPDVISIHAPRGGSDPIYGKRPTCAIYFNPRSPWGERHWFRVYNFPVTQHFNPRSPWGERLSTAVCRSTDNIFQSTLPVGGATTARSGWTGHGGISIHAPRGGSDLDVPMCN